ncbi:hypothetical protein DTL42_21225 [Bremerella cremea]|uniref:Uncharacterized protein n=1 Tax=Bremerella cremea TaxID=1031537 RepID=A0A368KK83_9BACT|nr:hypothetical protein DTL42_21225 [Bremerella cremea]
MTDREGFARRQVATAPARSNLQFIRQSGEEQRAKASSQFAPSKKGEVKIARLLAGLSGAEPCKARSLHATSSAWPEKKPGKKDGQLREISCR